MKNLFKTIKNSLLCIRYPFWYPRNRFSGKHYNCWKIIEKISELRDKSTVKTYINFNTDKKENNRYFSLRPGVYLRLDLPSRNKIQIVKESAGKLIEKIIAEIKLEEEIDSVWWGEDNRKIEARLVRPTETSKIYPTTIIHDPLKFYLSVLLKFVHNYPLQILHCFTSYTELDNMPEGWRKAFGKSISKEFKKALLHTGGLKALYSYRILDIKEKFGELRIYDNYGNKEIEEIIDKYTDLSRRTCIACGAPATKLTCGWISPYCDDCIPKDIKTVDIK